MLPHILLQNRLRRAVRAVLPDSDVSKVLVRPCPNPKFGDYQCSALIAIAKTRGINPRDLATKVASEYNKIANAEPTNLEIGIVMEIVPPGFFNFRLSDYAIAYQLERAARGEHLFLTEAESPKTIVIDFSSPNVAKPMHVGHIRSTGIGDALQRTLRLLGHRVISDNHIGDWGTQFGMLLVGWRRFVSEKKEVPSNIETLVKIYRTVAAQIADETANKLPAVKALGGIKTNTSNTEYESRMELVRLQSGENTAIWREMIRISQAEFDKIYSRLGVKFDVTLGESFYNSQLGAVVNDLLQRGIARESEGAAGVFSDGSLPPKEDPFLVNRDGEWVADPALVRKSDGGFNYTTTDLATLNHRTSGEILKHPEVVAKLGKLDGPIDEIIYVVDDRQSGHFKKLFATFARWQPDAAKKVKLVHVGFGKIMGDDGKPFKTRSGDTVKLGDLLDEAEERAFKIVNEKSPELPDAQKKEIARVIGLGAVKYADLLPNRQSDYIFSWDKMLALQGNTAPYLQYAYARIKSIFRKSVQGTEIKDLTSVQLAAVEELALAKHLLNFGITLEAVADELRPNYLCNYLFELAGKFTSFYENCPVLKAEEEATRNSRLTLCALTARVLKQGLETLGIEVVEQM